MNRLHRSLGVAACLLLLASGCGQQPGTADTKGAAKGSPRIALVMKSLANEFFKTMEDGARKHQQAHAAEYTLIANGIKDEQDVAKQVELVEQMIGQKVDAIVIAPADSKALVGVCQEAIEKGIVVVNIDNRFDAETLAKEKVTIPFAGPDNRKGARMAGEYLKFWGPLMAGYAVASIPIIILFVFSMKLFVRGLTEGAVKG